jgi:hypothetical protein
VGLGANMAINMRLAKEQGLSESDIHFIELIHKTLVEYIDFNCTMPFRQETFDTIENLEYLLQNAWGFDEDPSKHTWTKLYAFRCEWVGRKFKCTQTGKVFTIPYDVEECDFFAVGGGFVDVGRHGGYARFSGVEEIKDEGKV